MAQAVIRARTDLDTSGFQRGIASMQAGAARIKGLVAGAFSVGAIAAFAKSTISAGGDIADLADNLNVTTTQLQALQYGFRNAGADAEALQAILAKIKQESATAALEGEASKAAEAFAALGISLDEVSDLSNAEKLERIAKAFVDGGENAATYASVLDLIGKQGNKAENAIKALGKAGLASFIDEAQNAGAVASEAAIRAADRADDKLENLADRARKAAIEVAGIGQTVPEQASGGGKLKSELDREVRLTRERADQEKEAAKIRMETAERLAEHNRDMMSDTERMTALMAEMRYLDSVVPAFDASQLELAQLEKQKADAKIEFENLRKQMDDEDARKKRDDPVRFDALRAIGARALGGNHVQNKAEEHLKWIRATADKQLAALQEIARGGSRM